MSPPDSLQTDTDADEPLDEPEPIVVPTGPAPSFEEFYRREQRRVVGLAYVLCGRRSVAEEIAQDAFLATYRRWSEVRDPDAWVRRLVANRSVNAIQRRTREARALVRLRGGQSHVEAPELPADDERLWAEVRRLPRRQAQAVALRYADALSIPEIAASLDLSENTVKTHLTRARPTLARRLGDDVEEDDR
ncbi:MAG: sigma-70 family RNA polymerase sigma factor [Actinomycetota bacterium]|nr:sigma-70 family RNA polymerase sigma factor [Actinomycetota bacterium]